MRPLENKGDGRGTGCAIWDCHVLYAYDECNNDGKEGPLSNAKSMLDILIPMDEDDLYAEECSMFLQRDEECPQSDDQP